MRRFYVLDVNNDQRLSGFEFSKFFPPGNDAMVMSIFNTLDTDGDYYVTYEEIVTAVDALESGTAAPTEESNFYSESKDSDYTQDPEDELAHFLNHPGENTN